MTAVEPGFKVGNVTLKPVQIDIKTLQADALVQPSGTSKLGWPLQAAPWVIEADGDGSIAQALGFHAPFILGDVIITPPGPRLKARYLFHAVVVDWAFEHPSKTLIIDSIVTSVAQKCISVAAALGLKSIAFTPWGTRIGAVEPAHVTALLVQAVVTALQVEAGELETVYLVSRDPKHFQWFVDRTFVFRIILDQLRQASDAIAMLDIPDRPRENILAALQNAQRNVLVYNQVFSGAKYQVSIEEGRGVVIGDEASVALHEEPTEMGRSEQT
ncbi:MAG TPA: hypothetical protein PKM78_09040 [Anaerolineae bacterium]|nr:hypothetical protein [Anaerolineae bacterium]HNU03198.1 hypothetical protein [Anaerolineae bacterium]